MVFIYIWLAVVMGLLALLCYAQYTTEQQVNERIQEMDEFVKMLSQHTHEHFTRVESKLQDAKEKISLMHDNLKADITRNESPTSSRKKKQVD